jgi:PD-(D/E)XK nuclease superfamily
MSLFSRLLNLHTDKTPLEDFFTELVAHLFSTNQEILFAWLKYIGLLDTEAYLDAYISTQRTFEGLSHHNSDSRPDIVIELGDGTNNDIIFIESKIGSNEGYEQLPRYAEILDKRPNLRNKVLVYITRDFEPKDRVTILHRIPDSNIRFIQVRWHQFYQFLKAQTATILVEEIIKFMQEHQMAHNNQFSSIDVIALANFTKSLKLMEQTMWGEVSQRFEKILGSIAPISTTFTQFRLHERYLMYSWLPDKWWCGIGFLLNTSSSTDYPTVCLVLEVDPKSARQAEIIKAMKAICKENSDWKGYDLDNSKAWSRIVLGRSLQSFLSEEDHIATIKEFFLKSLDELNNIKIEYRDMPWNTFKDGGINCDNTSSSVEIDIDRIIMHPDMSIVEDMADIIDNNIEALGFAECKPGCGQ